MTTMLKAFFMGFVAPLSIVAGVIMLSSCGPTIGEVHEAPAVFSPCSSAIWARVVIDQSTSMSASGTPPVKTAELRPLIDRISECGGALAVGFVRETLQPGVARIDFPQLQPLPAEPVMREDEEPYEYADRVAVYHQLKIDRADSLKSGIETKKPEIERYLHTIDELLARPAAKGTDLNSALNAADLFLSESAKDGNCQKVLIIVSDGLDNRHKPRWQFKSGARVLWVNSTSDEKVLSGYGATRFESLKAAIDDIINNSQTRGAK